MVTTSVESTFTILQNYSFDLALIIPDCSFTRLFLLSLDHLLFVEEKHLLSLLSTSSVVFIADISLVKTCTSQHQWHSCLQYMCTLWLIYVSSQVY